MSQLGLRLEESDSSSSSDDEDHQLSIAEAYTVLDIRSGLLNPSRYCTAVQELKAVIQSLYKRRESTKEFKKNVEADVQTAIYEYHGYVGLFIWFSSAILPQNFFIFSMSLMFWAIPAS